MRIVLLGPPGAGKGTQAQVLAGHLDVPAISTGDIFRANVSGSTALGRRAKVFMDAGDLVPDEITVAMVTDRLAEPDANEGFLLDGFPRTIDQAQQLRATLAHRGVALDCVLELAVDTEELVRRLSGRRMLVDGQWVVRDDDKPETVRHRLHVYRELTAPLSEFYAAEGLLVRINAIGDIAAVTARALAALDLPGTQATPRSTSGAAASGPRRG